MNSLEDNNSAGATTVKLAGYIFKPFLHCVPSSCSLVGKTKSKMFLLDFCSKKHQGSATVIWQGAGWREQGANFRSVKSCNYVAAAGCPRGANSFPFQATDATFYELHSRLRGQWSCTTGLFTRHSGAWCHFLLKRPCNSHCASLSTTA